eukprot:TRINITY_DN3372_c0_g2_i5.p3 TRINITY_DN3372_c0_g2~~TRINITY_DN3372_c0_g2_i5.p3  ORF type:complete len:150 (+),score=12.93 TRINITY_DN3372_c0_g2_i5:100-549(+)
MNAFLTACTSGDAALVDRLLQVPGGVNASAKSNRPIKEASRAGHVAIVEQLLRDKRVVLALGLPLEVVHHTAIRDAVAIQLCRGNASFRGTMGAAFQTAYGCVRGEMYTGMAEQLCEWMWPVPLARQAVQIQRRLAAALQALRRCQPHQ